MATGSFAVPVLLVLYFLTVPNGQWPIVLGTQLMATVIVAVASGRFFATAIWVDETGLAERGYFGRRTDHPIETIGSIVLAETYIDGADTARQLFVCDHEGRQLVRMRGQFWSQESMDTVVHTLDVPITIVDEAVSTEELHTDFPGLLYWFERHPVWAAATFTGAAVALGVLVFIVVQVIGVLQQ